MRNLAPTGRLDGRIALVTGGGRGIGRGICDRLSADGAWLGITYRQREADAADLVAEITQQGGRAIAIRCDTSEEEDCRSAVEQVLAEFGAIDLLVSNAGVASRGKSVLDSDPSEFARLMHVHAFAVHHLCRAALPAMRTRPRSDIILVSSVLTSTFPPNTAPYTMAKAAAEALARVLAREEREHGVHVNIVAPGLVKTEMGRRLVRANLGYQDIDHADADSPFGHVCTPDEVGRVVSFLASCEASYINDQRLVVDGGSF